MKKEVIVQYAQMLRKFNSDPFKLANVLGYKVAFIEDPRLLLNVKTYEFDNQKLIIINQSLDLSRRKALCARELGYLILKTQSEHEANLFAVAYLFDKKDFNMQFVDMSNYTLSTILSIYTDEKTIYTPEIISNNSALLDSLEKIFLMLRIFVLI